MYKTPVNNGINHQPQLMNAGFLNHQQYHYQGDARQYEPWTWSFNLWGKEQMEGYFGILVFDLLICLVSLIQNLDPKILIC